jgi:hypothetical protein
VRIAIALPTFFCAATSLRAQTSVEIDLEKQMAYLLENGRVVLASPISSGRNGHLTEKGSFKVLERNEPIIRVCTARSSILAETPSLPTPMRTCRSRPGKFTPAPMHYFMRFAGADGMHAGYLPAIRLRTAVSGCRNNTRLRSSIQSVLAHRSRCTEARQPGATWGNHDRHFQAAFIGLETRASIQDLLRLRYLGGGDKS